MITSADIHTPVTSSWMSATELSRIYKVGPARLYEYSSRGDLPCTVSRTGEPLFDANMAEGLFRRRRTSVSAPAGGKFGVLGKMSLGPVPSHPSLSNAATPLRRAATQAA